MKKSSKTKIGIAIWIMLLVSLFITYYILSRETKIQNWTGWLTKQYQQYLVSPLHLKVKFEDWIPIRAGDKIYLDDVGEEESVRTEIGTVYARSEEDFSYVLYVNIYPEYQSNIGKESQFLMVREPGSPAWVVSKLLPKDRREELRKIVDEYLSLHAKNLQDQLVPIINEVAKESYVLLQQNFNSVMEKNKDLLLEKLKDVEKKHVDEELQKLWNEVIWPIILEESDPVIAPIVAELWGKFPKTKIVMLWIYQSLPGTDNDHVQKKIEEYLGDKAVPIVESHKKELAQLLITITQKVSQDEKVKASFLKMFKDVISDKDLLDVIKEMLMELYKINKETFTSKMKQKWEDENIRDSLSSVSISFESYLVKMINHILIKENKEIRPELAQVLRRQILYKDKYYLSVTTGKEKINTLSPPVFQGK